METYLVEVSYKYKKGELSGTTFKENLLVKANDKNEAIEKCHIACLANDPNDLTYISCFTQEPIK